MKTRVIGPTKDRPDTFIIAVEGFRVIEIPMTDVLELAHALMAVGQGTVVQVENGERKTLL